MKMFCLLRGADCYAPEPLGRRDVLLAAGRIARVAREIGRASCRERVYACV